MMKFVSGDILKAATTVVVVPMNTMGVFGAGLAKDACAAFPRFQQRYVEWCASEPRYGGDICWHHQGSTYTPRYIAGLCTKEHWEKPSQLAWVENGLQDIYRSCAIANVIVSSVSIPKVGCGLGGLDWTDVHGLITTIFKHAPFDTYVYM